MYLSAIQTKLLSRVMTTLAEPHHERDMRTEVVNMHGADTMTSTSSRR
jgi:hypothetical protein